MNDEELLLTGTSLDDLIKMKMEQELMEDMVKSKERPKPKVVKQIKDVPKEKIFAKEAVYRYFNRSSKCETFINGVQAEALIGTQNHVREKMLSGKLSAFTTDNAYVKFEKVIL